MVPLSLIVIALWVKNTPNNAWGIGLLGKVKHFYRNEAGNVMMIFVIMITAILALVGATLALSMDSKAAAELQWAADESALSGATAFVASKKLKLDDRLKEAEAQSTTAAAQNTNYKLADFDVLAASEDRFQQSITMAVELEFKSTNAAASMTGRNANVNVRRRAVAEATQGFPLCILTLSETQRGVRVHTFDPNLKLSAENCIIWSNSKRGDSISVVEGGLVAKGICTVGGHRTGGKAVPAPVTGCAPMPDPMEGYTVDVPATCDFTNFGTNRDDRVKLKPGVYCGGLKAWHFKSLEFAPGIYVIRDGPLRINAGKPVEIEGVTFLMDGNISFIDFEGGAGLKIRAPIDGETAGIAIAQIVPKGVAVIDAQIKGAIDLEGLLYLPSYDLSLRSAGRGTTKSPYIQMVVDHIELYGNVELGIDFDPEKTKIPVVIKPEQTARLIE